MAGKFGYSGPWFRAGVVFVIVFLIMVIVSKQQIEFYYLEEGEWGEYDSEKGAREKMTRSEYCDENLIEAQETAGSPSTSQVSSCSTWRFDTQISVVLTLLSIGFAMMCLAQSNYLEKEIEDKKFEEV